MTKMEKECVASALAEYALKHEEMFEQMAESGKSRDAAVENRRYNMALAILSYWKDIVNAPCGKTLI